MISHAISPRLNPFEIQDPHPTTSEPVVVVGAASKGIIKRDQQNNAVVYKSYYAQNPFAHVDNDELEKYKREVEQNQMREQGLLNISSRLHFKVKSFLSIQH